MFTRWWLALPAIALVGLSLVALAGCGGARHAFAPTPLSASRTFTPDTNWATVTLVPFNDQWSSADPRWLDLCNVPYSADFQSRFISSHSGTITVQYNTKPSGPRFECLVSGTGLKPNFCYQLKLVGKAGNPAGYDPTTSGLYGASADMSSNELILTNGRWWDYSADKSQYTTVDKATALGSTPYQNGWMTGYIYMGYFLTDQYGNTNGAVQLASDTTDPTAPPTNSHHVTWKSDQTPSLNTGGTLADMLNYTVNYTGATAYSDPPAVQRSIGLQYENEGYITQYALPQGNYHALLMVTEESFHGDGGTGGGTWDTVRVSGWSTTPCPYNGRSWVDAAAGPGTDVSFTISNGTAASGAAVDVTLAKSSRGYTATAVVTLKDRLSGAPISGATITGKWSGVYSKTGLSATTDKNGVARFTSQTKRAPSRNFFRFTVTNATAPSAWDGVQSFGLAYVP